MHSVQGGYAGEEMLMTITTRSQRHAAWESFAKWKKVSGCYGLQLANGPFLAIPRAAVPPQDVVPFEALLRKHIH